MQVESPHKFWVQSSMKVIRDLMKFMLEALNHTDAVTELPVYADLGIGSIYAAHLDLEDNFHRCRIIAKKEKKKSKEFEYTVGTNYRYILHNEDYE